MVRILKPGFISKPLMILFYSLEQFLSHAINTIYLYVCNSTLCTVTKWSHFPPSYVCSFITSGLVFCISLSYYYYFAFYEFITSFNGCFFFYWRSTDSKYPLVSRNILRILVDHNSPQVLTSFLIFRSFSIISRTILITPTTKCITATLMFLYLYSSLVRSSNLFFFPISFLLC